MNQVHRIEFTLPEDVKENADAFRDESPLYLATHAIVQSFVAQLSNGEKVLEIGCGSWDYCKNLCEQKGAIWYGLDPLQSEKNRDVVATHRGSVHSIPFPDASFDHVIGNQTIEHWHEFGVAFDEALSEIWRVLKPGGKLILNAPIYLHGHRIFLLYDMESISSLFPESSWNIRFEEWLLGESEPYLGWKRSRFSADVFPELKDNSSFVLNIVATKSSTPPERSSITLYQEFLRIILKLCRTTNFTRLAAYHLHYGPRHYLNKLKRGILKRLS